MKTMIWKELRENLHWALLVLVVLLLAQLYALSSGDRTGDTYGNYSLCSSTFLLMSSFGCAVAGAVLGSLQILPELRRDRWAALLHRPVSRGTIFLGKAAAGMTLYLLATLVPFLVSIAYVAMPGQFAIPLVPGLMVPAASDICFGAVCYFAALLICLHRGRWLGSRGAMVLSLIPAFVLHVTNGWPFLYPLALALVFLLAARGAMLTNGPIREMPATGRAACITVIFVGSYTALLLAAWGMQALQGRPTPFNLTYSTYRVTRDGQVYLSTQKGDGTDQTLTDKDGNPVTDKKFLGNDSYQYFVPAMPLVWEYTLKMDSEQKESRLGLWPRLIRNYMRAVERRYDSKEAWYFLVDQKYFIGYDKLSRRCVGICDAKGFHLPGTVPQPFSEILESGFSNSAPVYLFWEGAQLYGIEFPERRLTPLLQAGDDRICGAIFIRQNDDSPRQIAVAQKSGIRLIDAQGAPIGKASYLNTPGWWYLTLGVNEAGDRMYLGYPPGYTGSGEQRKSHLVVSDMEGRVLESYSHGATSGAANSKRFWATEIIQNTLPPVLALIGALDLKLSPPLYPAYSSFTYPRPAFGVAMAQLPALLGVALALAIAAFSLARRAGISAGSAGRWALFVAAFGLPAFVAFAIAADWPRRRACPNCHRKRPVEKEDCPHCQIAWQAPAKTGSEILEPI